MGNRRVMVRIDDEVDAIGVKGDVVHAASISRY